MIQKKICLIGTFAVGKTSLVRRFVSGIFSEKYLTTFGVKIDRHLTEIGGRQVSLVLWDLAGDDDFSRLDASYVRGSGGYLLVADGTRPHTLDRAVALQDEVERVVGDVPFTLVLNKTDLNDEWMLGRDALEGLGHRWEVALTSAKTGEGVEAAFASLAARMVGA